MLKEKILPSLLAADPGHLAEGCALAENAGGDELHVDIMDGHFVPNLSFGPAMVAMARKATRLPQSVHLMVSRPDFFADPFIDAGSHLLLIHVEASCDVRKTLRHIRSRGVRPGIVLNPETPVALAEPYLDEVDEVLFMTVHPGFGGQAFLSHVVPKISALRKLAPQLDLSVDGGINDETAVPCARAGANILIAGTHLYRMDDMAAGIQRMRSACAAAWAT